jgi:integrase
MSGKILSLHWIFNNTKMITVKFFIRPSKKYPTKKANIYVRVANGRKFDYTTKTGWEILPAYFNNETQTIKQRVKFSTDPKENLTIKQEWEDKLKGLKQKIEKELSVISGPTKDDLLLVIDKFNFPNKYKKKATTLFSFIQDFIDNAPHRINPKTNKPVSYKMIREYHASFGYLKEYAKVIGKEIDFDDIDLEFYDGFKAFLETYRSKTIKNGLALNTVGKKIQTLKIFLNEATARGINTNLKYQSTRFIAVTEESDNIYLTIEEIEKIYNLDLSDKPKLERVRDLFVIGCWTGLRFSDWNKIRPENIQDGFLSLKQQKTGQPVVIPLHPTVQAILDKYDGDLPRPITNQKFNEYLKQVAKLANFKEAITKQITRGGETETLIRHKWEMVTTHTARRSFATNMYKMGIPSITIMAITGHRTETAFLKYIKVTPQEHAERMREIWLNNGSHLKVAK